MFPKKIFIPAVAFGLLATGASAAFAHGNLFENLDLNLSDSQIAALEEAREIRQSAEEEASQLLEEAGIDEETMRDVREAMQSAHQAQHKAIQEALEAQDYDAFVAATVDMPLSESITSQADFMQLVEAHQLRQNGDYEGARAIMDELGIDHGPGVMGRNPGGKHRRTEQLSAE